MNDLSAFRTKLEPQQKKLALTLLDCFVDCIPCDYYLAYGTLLGAVLYEGFIPWDDDLDIQCLAQDYALVKTAVEKHPNLLWFDFHIPGNRSYAKVCFKTGGIANTQFKWSWPFIDIYWLNQRPDNTWVDSLEPHRYPSQILHPTRMIHFEGNNYMGPNQPHTVVLTLYPDAFDYARPPWWDHVQELAVRNYKNIAVPLADLLLIHPQMSETLNRIQRYRARQTEDPPPSVTPP